MGRATNIITLIISTSRRLLIKLRRGRGSKTAKTRLSASNATNPSVHLTHLIRKMVKTTTKISTHELKLIHNGSESDPYSRRRRWSRRGRGLRGKDSVLSIMKSSLLLLSVGGLIMRPLGLSGQLCITSSNRLSTNGTNDREERGRKNKDVHVCEDACDS